MQKENLNIEETASDFYNTIAEIYNNEEIDNKEKSKILFNILQRISYAKTKNIKQIFANLYSRIEYICSQFNIDNSIKIDIHRIKHDYTNHHYTQCDILFNIKTLVRLVSFCYNATIPKELQNIDEKHLDRTEIKSIGIDNKGIENKGIKNTEIDSKDISTQNADSINTQNLNTINAKNKYTKGEIFYTHIRISVLSFNDKSIIASVVDETCREIAVNYTETIYDLSYIREYLHIGMQMNLLDVKIIDNHYIPKYIILNPDYLINVSSIANNFENYGRSKFNYLVKELKERQPNYHLLLGNLADDMLDNTIHSDANPYNYSDVLTSFLKSNVLEFMYCQTKNELSEFHAQAKIRMANIKSIISDLIYEIDLFESVYDKDKILLESSFISEILGITGRVDMIQNDFKLLIEHKSGKMDEFHSRHKENHYVQILLYFAVLKYNFSIRENQVNAFLLYSKYPNGLMSEGYLQQLIAEAFKVRNDIVALEIDLANGMSEEIFPNLYADDLNTFNVDNILWKKYNKPQLESILNNYHSAFSIEKAYFNRYYTFIKKEQLYSKIGNDSINRSGYASLWNMSLEDKIANGSILFKLCLKEKAKSSRSTGYDIVKLNIPKLSNDFNSHMRAGDMVVLYSYKEKPIVCRALLMTSVITNISKDTVSVRLINSQKNETVIGSEKDYFAIEPIGSDVMNSRMIAGLNLFLEANRDRKDLLLQLREPSRDLSQELNRDYGIDGYFNDLVLKSKQANDYLLLVGPPGTGKTSQALKYMIEDALDESNGAILLMSYTNRAVDEICSMLIESGIAYKTPFLRISSEVSCPKAFRPFLLSEKISEIDKLGEMMSGFNNSRIIVATTSKILGIPYLFKLKSFSHAFIDEASQILESQLIGILSAKNRNGEDAIKKFILIGDNKQLPAVVLQSQEDSIINNKLLNDKGFTNCSQSLFERLLKNTNSDFIHVLRKQGRMHPQVAEFSNISFYFKENLMSLNLSHQVQNLSDLYNLSKYKDVDADILKDFITSVRLGFIASEFTENRLESTKSNTNEAIIIADLIQKIIKYRNNFNPSKSIGIIVPYRNQITVIRNEIEKLGIHDLENITIDTVERYQGSQRDIIIYSFTVQNLFQLNFLVSNCFVEDDKIIDRKLNVAMTRAREQMFLIGNPKILSNNPTFYKLMKFCKERNAFLN